MRFKRATILELSTTYIYSRKPSVQEHVRDPGGDCFPDVTHSRPHVISVSSGRGEGSSGKTDTLVTSICVADVSDVLSNRTSV